jgi:hypothetical protein
MTSYLVDPINYEALKSAVVACKKASVDGDAAAYRARDLVQAAGGPQMILDMYEALRRSTYEPQ